MAAKGLIARSSMLFVYILLFVIWNCLAVDDHPQYTFSGPQALRQHSYEIELFPHSLEKRELASPASDVSTNSDNGTDVSSTAAANQDNGTSADNGSPSVSQGATVAPNIDVTTQSSDPVTTVGPNPFEEADIMHDNHKYYTSDYTTNSDAQFDQQWIDLETSKAHSTLSNGHRVAAVIPLKFNFSFYGHEITKITVATGGFIYMSPFLHQWLTATQYIAPLMANFDPSLRSNSSIFYQSGDTHFTVEWKHMVLRDQQQKGSFHFQATLFQNDTIRFAYKSVPVVVTNISSSRHPVKVGLSDAYYNDTYVPKYDIKRRTIYEYHKVTLNQTLILKNTVVYIKSLPTCNKLKTCDACSSHPGTDFECKWCNKIGRCSDGLDWYRQHWDQQGCRTTHTVDSAVCSSLPTPTNTIVDPHDTSMYDARKCAGGNCDKKSSPVVIVILIIVFILILVGGIGGWVYYAYTHPTSKSGMWLMEHRPSQIKAKIKFWKSSSASSSGAKYQTETDA